jgi:CBS domain containing-hemolysin-like protein
MPPDPALATAAAPDPGLTAAVYVIAGLVLLGCNFFFVMSEFAFVKVRDSQVAALAVVGDPRAEALRHIKGRLDEYLSVVQIGITGATIGMGIVIDEGIGQLVEHAFLRVGWSGTAANLVSVAIAFATATYLTIVTSELVPKAIAIRNTERAALAAARPMRLMHRLFWLPMMLLKLSARLVLRLLGFRHEPREIHSEDELRIILGESQAGGVMTFRRLLLFENLFDLGDTRVRNAMRPRTAARTLPADGTRDDLAAAVAACGYSRYPIVAPGADPAAPPLGVVHAKEVLTRLAPGAPLSSLARPYLTFQADTPLERALGDFQRSRNHLAIALDGRGGWIGIITFEDVIEEIVGSIEDEFERDQPLHLDELLAAERIVLDVPAASIEAAIGRVVQQVPLPGLPGGMTAADAARRLLERERSLSTCVGRGIAIPHARIDGLDRPIVIVVRITPGAAVANRRESVRLLFILLVPSGSQRLHLRLLARIAQIAESDYLFGQLIQAGDPAAVIEALAASDRAVAD